MGKNLVCEVERKIGAEGARATTETFLVKVMIYTDDRPGMLNQLTSVLFAEQSNIRSLEASSDQNRGSDRAVIDMTIEIRDKKQLELLVDSIPNISGCQDMDRIH